MNRWGRLLTQVSLLIVTLALGLLIFRIDSAYRQSHQLAAILAQAAAREARYVARAIERRFDEPGLAEAPDRSASFFPALRAAVNPAPQMPAVALFDSEGAPLAALGDTALLDRAALGQAKNAGPMTLDEPLFTAGTLALVNLPRWVVADADVQLPGSRGRVRLVHDAGAVPALWRKMVLPALVVLLVVGALAQVLFILMLRRPISALQEASRFAAGLPQARGERLLRHDSGLVDIDVLRDALNDTAALIEQQRLELEASARRQQVVLDGLKELVYQVKANGAFEYVNAAWQRELGYDVAGMRARRAAEVIDPLDVEAVRAAFRRLFRGEIASWRGQFRLLATDGSSRLFDATAAPLRDGSGRVIAAMGTLADVGERQAHELALDAERQLLQDVLDNLPLAVSIKQLDDTLVRANRYLASQFGRNTAALRGVVAATLGPSEFEVRMGELDRRLIAGAPEVADELPLRVEGIERTVRVNKKMIRAGANRQQLILTYGFDITEQRRDELERQRERALLQAVLDTASTPIYVKDAGGRYVLVNREFCASVGRSAQEVLGRTVAEAFPELASLPQRAEADRRVLQEGVEAAYEWSIVRNGAERHYWTVKRPLSAADGERQLLAVSTEITDRKRHERALERGRALLRAVLDANADCIYAKDADGRFALVNRAFLQTFRLREEDVLGRSAPQIFTATPLLERSLAEDDVARRAEHPTTVEQKVRLFARPALPSAEGRAEADAEGRMDEERDFLVTRQSIVGPDGAAWMLGVARDVTELRRQEALLARQQQFMREVIDLDTNLIFVRDARMRYLLVNRAYAQLFGRRMDEMVGLTPWDLFANPQQIDHALAADRRVLDQGIEVTQEDVFTINGEDHHYLAVKKPIVAPDGSVGILAITRDITELRRGEQRLRAAAQASQAANEAKSRFLANMSHEIRTPINGILGMIDLALRTESLREQRQYLDLAQSSAEALLAIVNDVLDFSKIEAGGMTVETVPFSLYDLINEITKPLALKANEKRLDFFNRVSPHLPLRLLGDPTRLRQVLMNLIGNAIKFTSSGEVTLEVESTAPPAALHDTDRVPVRFVVRDSGAGISKEQQATIFEAFTQVDTSVARRFGGTGLGLTISARLVELMGGKLEVDSQLGAGSRFWFVLNLPFERGASGSSMPTYRHFPELNALWIDPQSSSRAWFTHVLRLWDVQATGAASVAEVLRLPAGTKYDVVFVDGLAVSAAGPRLTEFLGTLHGARVFALLAGQETVPPVLRDALGERCAALLKPLSPLDLHRALSQVSQAGGSIATFEGAGEAAADHERPFDGLRFLLAEDNYVNRVLAVAVLERLGARLQLAEQGAEALGLMKQAEFDVVLMDVQMPVMDGVEAVRRWRQIERAEPPRADHNPRRIPVIAMTAHALSGDRERFLEAGFDGYISKPFRESDLVGEVLRLLAPVRAARLAGLAAPPLPETQFSIDVLCDIFGRNETLVLQVIGAFLAVRASLYARLTDARTRHDGESLRKVAHEIKGMTGMMGARRLQALAAAVELAGRRAAWEEVDALDAAFEHEWQHVTSCVESYTKST